MQHLLMECAVRAALIALGTAAVLRLLRVKTAGARHAAWVGVLVLMLMLPAWTAWGPRASMRVLPATAAPSVSRTSLFLSPAMSAATDAVVPASAMQPGKWSWWMCLAAVYFLGFVALLTRLALGTLRARALVRHAAAHEGRLISPSCAAPVTVGWLRPTVILPECWRTWSQAQLDAVMTHEREHARRRDPLVQWLALLNRAVFWFHPLAWWLERRLSALAEEACDAAVLARGHDPIDYSEYLLELARSVGRSGLRISIVGMAMPGSSLPRRIRQILARRPAPRITRMRALCLVVACVMVSTVFAAATVDRQQVVPEPPLPPAPPAAPVAAHPPAPPAPPANLPEPPAPAQPPMPPVPPPPPEERRLIALYFDLRAVPADAQARAIAAATQFVGSQMRPQDEVAVMSWDRGHVKVDQDFTDDRDLLVSTIQKISGDGSAAVDADQQLDSLHSAFDLLGGLRAKKALVYFTAGAVSTAASSSRFQAAIDAAIRANVAIYPFDTRGLLATDSYPPPASPLVLGAGDQISVAVLNNTLFDGKYTVRPDGTISLPILGDIKAAGLTPAQLQAVINDHIATSGIVKDPRSSVTVVGVHNKGK